MERTLKCYAKCIRRDNLLIAVVIVGRKKKKEKNNTNEPRGMQSLLNLEACDLF